LQTDQVSLDAMMIDYLGYLGLRIIQFYVLYCIEVYCSSTVVWVVKISARSSKM